MLPPPSRLRVEHLDEALGIDVERPRLSWWLPTDASRQVAYRIETDSWDSGRVESARSVLVPYEGPAATSAARVTWRVKAWTDAGETAWSEPSWWEWGILFGDEWAARWVLPPEPHGPPPAGRRPGYLLRHEFRVERPVRRARLHATARGVYEPFLNGARVGDHELTPGFTSYGTHLHVQTFDVTDAITPGRNVVGAILSDGWFRGQTGYLREADGFGDQVGFLAQLQFEHVDGGSSSVVTGDGWECATGAILAADLIEGQSVDLRLAGDGWCRPGGEDRTPAAWMPSDVADRGPEALRTSPAPPVRPVETVRPVHITRPKPDRHVVDLGQNINGWVRLTDVGPPGTTLTLTHGEALDGSGDVTLDHLERAHPLGGVPIPVGQVDRVVSDGATAFEARHTTHGFRFVRVMGHPGDLTADDVTGVVVHTDLRRTGWFRCSDERVNRLHDAAVWSFRDNACDIPTDCPQRERSGWTGDWQLYVPTASFLFDVAGFSAKWLRDLAADQRDDGLVRNTVPCPRRPGVPEDQVRSFIEGSAGWGDAAVIVPWEIWRAYGDGGLLEEQWPSMVAWVEYAAGCARARRHPARERDRPVAAPHERFLWDTGFHWGEWLEPGQTGPVDFMSLFETDHGDVATAYLHRSAVLLADTARVLGHDADASRFDELAASVLNAWRREYIAPDGRLRPATQANHVRALALGLVPDELRASTASRLVRLIREAGTHLSTGFLATPHLLPVLADTGHVDVAYELLLQPSPPSWLAMVDRGATTIWESWEGLDEDGVAFRSLNHYSKGAVVSFLHTHTAGIRLVDGEPAYRRFVVEPRPGGGLRWARATHDSPYGRIESSWRIAGRELRVDVVVPPGTAAEVRMPDGTCHPLSPGAASLTSQI